MGFVSQDTISQVLDRANIVEVISSYIPLKRAGKNFKANCPFHHEKTPSFVVNPDKQIFHCFGCGLGGNTLTYLMHQERIDFPEAVKMLAGKYGIAIELDPLEAKTVNFKELLYKANELAAQFFHGNLVGTSSSVGHIRKYLKDRGI